MPAIYEHEHVVSDEEVDPIGHVNNLAYLRWMLDAAIAHATAQGWPPQRHLERGSGWVVRSHAIEYLRPAFSGDQVVVRTWVADFRRITSRRKYQVVRPADATLLAIAQTNWVYIEYARGIPRRVPAEVIEAFELVSEAEEP